MKIVKNVKQKLTKMKDGMQYETRAAQKIWVVSAIVVGFMTLIWGSLLIARFANVN